MPRPNTKTLLLEESQKEYAALEQFLNTLTPQQMTEPGALRDWSVKDVLAHLLEWQQMTLGWYNAGLCGEKPILPAPGYKWSEIPALNQAIYEKHQPAPLEEIVERFRASHRQVMELLHSLSDEQLFTPGQYAWTQNNTLGTYFVSNTSSHYRWARTEMRKQIKKRKPVTGG